MYTEQEYENQRLLYGEYEKQNKVENMEGDIVMTNSGELAVIRKFIEDNGADVMIIKTSHCEHIKNWKTIMHRISNDNFELEIEEM